MKSVLIALGLALVAVVIYGFIEPRLLDVEEEVAAIPNLPEEWEGQEIAVLGDFQIGLWLDNGGTVEEAVNEIVERDPAAVLILGDYLYHPNDESEDEVAQNVEILRPLNESGIPVFSVLGNHDYGLEGEDAEPDLEAAENIRTAVEDLGIRILHNEAVALDAEGEELTEGEAGLYIAGVGSEWMNEDVATEAISEIPEGAPRVVMMHNPNSFPEFAADTAPFAVAGHTHGGQIRVPGLPQWSWIGLTSEEPVHTDGWIQDENFGEPGNQLYVNRGIGMSVVPIRIHAQPELTMFTLIAAD